LVEVAVVNGKNPIGFAWVWALRATKLIWTSYILLPLSPLTMGRLRLLGGSHGSMIGNLKTLSRSFMRLLLGKDGMWNKPPTGIAWISKIKMDINLTIPHIREFIILWRELLDVSLRDEMGESVTWNLAPNGEYTTILA
jgi:hypothetical protein